MPDRPSVHAPRRNFASTVSAWSSRVCGSNGIETRCTRWCFGQELPEPGVAKPARSLFNALGRLGDGGIRAGFGLGVDAALVKRQVELRGKIAHKGKIAVGLCAAQAVMQMGDMKHEAKLGAATGKHAQKRDGVCAAGDSDAETQAGREERRVER